MSLNESPVDVNVIAKIHQKVRENLKRKPNLIRKISARGESHLEEMHQEYWILDTQQENPWIFITIGDLYHPPYKDNYSFQVVCTIPPAVWEDPKYSSLKDKLQVTEYEQVDEQLTQIVSRKTGDFSYSEGVFTRETDELSIVKESMKISMTIQDKINTLIAKEDVIQKEIKLALDEYLQHYR